MKTFPTFLRVIALLLLWLWSGPANAQTADPLDQPLFEIYSLTYQGAFRVNAGTFGASNINFAEGPLVHDPADNSILIVGHAHEQAIARFPVPDLVNSTVIADLNRAERPSENFVTVLDRATGGNPDNLNRIGGLALLPTEAGPVLVGNAYEYYDADGGASQTTFIAHQPTALAASEIEGFLTFKGGAGHTSGWISPVLPQWQASLGGDYITGQSSGIPIISRTSVGPSAFAFNADDLLSGEPSTPIETTKLLDFSLSEPLNSDLDNSSGTNDLWTHLSRAVYGFIAPDSRTYVTLGQSGGHASGVCYKCTQSNGNLCGGYCAPDAGDYDAYYWLWDMADLLAVKAGEKEASSIRPYDYGPLALPFNSKSLGGGSFDPASGQLYLTLQRADTEAGTYANPPIIAVFNVGPDEQAPAMPTELKVE